MRFDRLKIIGFKTFVDPIEFVIEPGLTGIVGPNGCGKSNLVEALRWVMGETSHKSMRASGMDDVIFGGSGGRPARNAAEVMLRIDNSDHKAPASFNDSDVLEISRRIEREEGSTYRVNTREVRARDVQLLFADAASGARSPAMVRQGQIGEIIAAKPQSRRRILEDAAGIAGLHSRRHEAELRLKAAEENLVRVEDVLKHIDGQLDSLRRQARQAQRYKDVAAQIRKAEALQHHLAFEDARSQLAAAGRQLDLDTRLVADRTREQGEAARSQAVAEHELEPLRLEEARTSAALQRLQLAREGLEAEERRSKARMAELDRRLTELDSDLTREAQLVEDAARSVGRLSEEETELLAAEEAARAGEALAGSAGAEAEAALQAAEARLAECQSRLADHAARRNAAERAARDAAERLARSEKQLDVTAKEQADVAEKATAPASEISALKRAAAEAEAALAAAEAVAAEAERLFAENRDAETALRPALAEAERAAQRFETEAGTIRKMLDGGAGDLWPPILDKIVARKGFETALGAALGEDLDASSEATAPVHWAGEIASDAQYQLALLPPGAEPLSHFVEAPPQLRRRLDQIGLVDKSRGAGLQKLLRTGQRLVSVEGDLWRWDGFCAAAEAPTAAARRLKEKNRLGEVEAAATEAVEKRDALRRRAEAAIAAARNAANIETLARNDVRARRATLEGVRQTLTQSERRQAELSARLLALSEAVQRLSAARDEARAADGEARATLAGLAEGHDLSARLETERSAVALARAVASEARAALQTARREAELRTRRLAAIRDEQSAWQTRAARADAVEAEMRERLEGVRAERRQLEEAPVEFATKRRAILHEIELAETARKQASDAKASGETIFAEFDRIARTALSALSEAREQRARSEGRLEAARQRLDEATRIIVDQLETEPSQLPRIAGLEPDAVPPAAAAVEAALAELRRERERIGAVNLQADTELSSVEASQQNLIAERDDLGEAVRRLRRGIDSLNAEGRQRLVAAFDVVNAQFRRLFTTLFGGGEADLILIESEDPLEAGLEIVAKPPGKKPQVLTLLSGGEQALTATALIFAVFLTNPSPICVLDEIDAPLDDANVERLCNLLDEMVKQTDTRFITITHNPITMARMDRLFGVTMAERGVSQLVSVDLLAAARLAEAS